MKENDRSAKLERYLITVSEVAALVLAEPNLEQVLPRALELLRTAADADRCALFEEPVQPDGAIRPRLWSEACAPGLPSVATLFQPGDGEDAARRAGLIRATLEADEPFRLGQATLSPADQRFFASIGVNDLLLLPLQVGGRLWGKIAFDSRRREVTREEQEVRLLRAAADVIGLAIERQARIDYDRQIADSVHEGIGVADNEFRITYVNRSLAAMLRQGPEEVLGLPIADYLDPAGIAAVDAARERRRQSPGSDWNRTEHEMLLRRCDGTSFWATVAVQPLLGASGKNIGSVATIIDITERQELERRRHEAAERYSSLVEAQTDLLYRWTPDFTITFVNRACSEAFGLPPEEMLGRSWLAVLPVPEPEIVPPLIAAWLRAPTTFSHEHPAGMPDGRLHWIEWTEIPIRDAAGAVVEVQSVGRDVTERHEREELLRQRNRELAEQTRRAEEAATALRVLLKHTEQDRRDIEAKVLDHVRRLIDPTIEQLKRLSGAPAASELLLSLERRLNEIASPFLAKLSAAKAGLTPREIEVADLVRAGRSCKEIADALAMSELTVKHHRRALRRKLNLDGKKVNLRGYLLSLE